MLGTTLTLFGLLISVNIARRQTAQMNDLTEIETKTQNTTEVLTDVGTQTQELVIATKDIASALQTNARTQENIKNFFPQNYKKDEKYKLFFPGDSNQKTLPLINAGDSYGMYVISGLLGADLRLRPIARHATSIKRDELNCNAILLCDVNIALRELFDFNTLTDLNERKPNQNNLPCWFATYDSKLKYPDSKYGDSFIINIYDTKTKLKRILFSQSEESCIEAKKLAVDEPFQAKSIQEDYGIIARLTTTENHKYIIIAGVHGYGTIIVASFLDDLIRGRKSFDIEKYQNIFFSDNDFISVIHGDFDPTNFLVTRHGIPDGYIWVKDGEWNLAQ